MLNSIKTVAIVLAVNACAAVLAQSLIDAENLLFSPPKDFKVGFQSSHDNRMMTEFVHVDSPDLSRRYDRRSDLPAGHRKAIRGRLRGNNGQGDIHGTG